MNFIIDLKQETDGRWISEIGNLPGVMVYSTTKTEALARVQALALRVVAERLEHGESTPENLSLSFKAA